MFTPFNSESLWMGNDMGKYNAVLDLLAQEGIPYRQKARSHMGQFSGRGGSMRGTYGTLGMRGDCLYEYEVFVYKKDFDRAKFLLNRHREMLR